MKDKETKFRKLEADDVVEFFKNGITRQPMSVDMYDSNRLGSWVFIGDIEKLNNYDDLYWSYVAEFMADNNDHHPYTRDGSPQAELAYFKKSMPVASFNEVGLFKALARADQHAKERIAMLGGTKE